MEIIAAPVVIEAAKHSAGFLATRIGYLVYYKNKVDELSNKVDDLSSLINDIQWKVYTAERRGEKIFQVVERWQNKVDEVLDNTWRLIHEANKINSFSKGWCSERYRIGKKAIKMTNVVTELLNERSNLVELSEPRPILNLAMPRDDNLEAIAFMRSTVEIIISGLSNNKLNILGVIGMSGFGKTILMRQIYCVVKQKYMVLMVHISANHDLERIQDEIAQQLCLSFGQQKGEGRARRLLMRLKREKNVVIILDGVSKMLKLVEVGIPINCKVLLTTTNQYVPQEMRTDCNYQLKNLSEEDSWELLKMTVGTNIDSPDIKPVAMEVMKQCWGLPMALVTVGRAMREKDEGLWRNLLRSNVIQQLRESAFTNYEDILGAFSTVMRINISVGGTSHFMVEGDGCTSSLLDNSSFGLIEDSRCTGVDSGNSITLVQDSTVTQYDDWKLVRTLAVLSLGLIVVFLVLMIAFMVKIMFIW